MNTSRLRLSYLFNCYYNKTATPQESDELFAIISAGKKDQELSDLIYAAWNDLHLDAPFFNSTKTELILNNILASGSTKKQTEPAKPIRNLLLWAKFSAAAVGLLFLSFGIYNYLHKNISVVEKPIAKINLLQHDALPGSNKAILTLANGKTIILDNAQNGTLAKQGHTTVNKAADGKLVYNLSNIADDNVAPSINTISTPRGGEYQVILPDGTKVWLNAASSLRFPTRFTGNSRDVEITGEAYFEVTKNKLMPFRVKTSRASIEVLGTHFNVMAYDDENLMKTTLLEGAVNIKSGSATYKLTPGQQAQINATGNTKVTSNIDVDDEVAWKNGIFQFRDAGIDVILRQASRWYDVNVTYKGKVPPKEFTGRLSRNVKASALLNMIKYTGIDLHIEGKNIIVD
jgi:ferric-dicitrate binding protein FerR (iron transport regulator)